jgi:replicative DNA helicase
MKKHPNELLDRAPPNDIAAEKAVLASVLLDHTRWRDADILSSDDFYNPCCRTIFTAMRRLAADGKPICCTSLVGNLRDHGEYNADTGVSAATLHNLFWLRPWAYFVGYYVGRVKEFSRRRHGLSRGLQAIQRAHNFDATNPTLPPAAIRRARRRR